MEVGLSVSAAVRGARWTRTRGALAARCEPWSAEGMAMAHLLSAVAARGAFERERRAAAAEPTDLHLEREPAALVRVGVDDIAHVERLGMPTQGGPAAAARRRATRSTAV